jgi:hypothetical protein
MRHRVEGGRGADRRGVGWRRQGRSPVAGRRSARRSRKRHSLAGEAWDRGCSGARSGGRHGVDRLGWRRRGHEGRQRGVEWAGRRATGGQWVGGTRRVRGAVRGWSVGRAGRVGGVPGSVGRLDCWVQVMDL